MEALSRGGSAAADVVESVTRDEKSDISGFFKVEETRNFLAMLYSCERLFRHTLPMTKVWVQSHLEIFGGVCNNYFSLGGEIFIINHR